MTHPDYYDKSFQAEANQWWCSLSINQMKAFEQQHQTCRPILRSEIARIYYKEKLNAL